MTTKIKKVYKSAIKNTRFLQDIKEADNDTKPNFLSSDLEKHLFAAIYYGWLVGKYGNDWELNL